MFKVISRPDLESYKKLWWSRPATYVFVVAWSVLILLQLVNILSALLLISVGESGFFDIVFNLLLLSFGIFFLVRLCRMPNILYNKAVSICPDQVETLVFSSDSMISDTVGTAMNEHIELPYSRLVKGKYKNSYFLLYTDANRMITFHARDIAEGSPNDLLNLLCSKMPARFKVVS